MTNPDQDMSEAPLAPHCYHCGRVSCVEGRFLTWACPRAEGMPVGERLSVAEAMHMPDRGPARPLESIKVRDRI